MRYRDGLGSYKVRVGGMVEAGDAGSKGVADTNPKP